MLRSCRITGSPRIVILLHNKIVDHSYTTHSCTVSNQLKVKMCLYESLSSLMPRNIKGFVSLAVKEG